MQPFKGVKMNIVESLNLSNREKYAPFHATAFNPQDNINLVELLEGCLIEHEMYDYSPHDWICMLFVLEDYTKNAKATGEEFVAIWFDNN